MADSPTPPGDVPATTSTTDTGAGIGMSSQASTRRVPSTRSLSRSVASWAVVGLIEHEEETGLVEAAPAETLVDLLFDLPTMEHDPDYLFDFLVTYEYFMSSATLLLKLVDVYFRAAYARDAEASSGSGGGSPGSNGGGSSFGRKVSSRRSSRPHFRTLGKIPSRRKVAKTRLARAEKDRRTAAVVNVLHHWVDLNFESTDVAMLDDMLTFLDTIKNETPEHEALVNDLSHRIILLEDAAETSPVPALPHVPLASIKPRKGRRKSTAVESTTHLMAYPVDLVARQLTLMDAHTLMSVQPAECISQNFRDHPAKAPNFVALKNRFNALTMWVARAILSVESIKARAQMIGSMIAMVAECLSLNNFHSALAMLGGLNKGSVTRLKKTWTKVDSSQVEFFEEQVNTLLLDARFRNYQSLVAAVEPPFIPLIAYHEDILFRTDENNPTYTDTGLVNFGKCRMIGKSIRELQSAQEVHYYIDPVPEIQAFLVEELADARASVTDARLSEMSFALVPRGGAK